MLRLLHLCQCVAFVFLFFFFCGQFHPNMEIVLLEEEAQGVDKSAFL